MMLTEAEVRTRLQEAIQKSGNMNRFCKINRICQPVLYNCMLGRYNDGAGGFPPSVLATVGIRKQVVYVLPEENLA